MGSEQKKIMFFIGSMGKGGAERVVANLANDYAEKGWKVEIIMLLTDIQRYPLHPGIRLIPLCHNNRSRIQQVPMWLRGIRSLIKRSNPAVVVAFAARINALVLLSCMGLKKKIIVSERNDPKKDGRTWFIKVAVRILYPFAHTIIFQTTRAMSYFPKSIQKKGKIIANPIYVNALQSTKPKKKIVSVGRLSAQKNHKLLIEAFYQLHRKYPEFTLTIYGEGELRDDLEKQIKSAGLTDSVFLPGICDNIHEEISDACMFVLSSDYEGLSNALLEAMMMGIPCISTDCAGSEEYIDHGVNGWLSPKGNADELCKAMETLILDEALKKELGRNGRKSVEQICRREAVFAQWNAITDEIITKTENS